MAIDINRATQIQQLLEGGPIHSILTYAQKGYPNECCGFVLDGGAVFPAQNVIDTLYDPSLTSKVAFLIDGESWKQASSHANSIICIYHSHTNGDPRMSEMDKYTLRWKDLCYVIIGLVDTNPTSAKLFWWEGEDLHELDIKLQKETE